MMRGCVAVLEGLTVRQMGLAVWLVIRSEDGCVRMGRHLMARECGLHESVLAEELKVLEARSLVEVRRGVVVLLDGLLPNGNKKMVPNGNECALNGCVSVGCDGKIKESLIGFPLKKEKRRRKGSEKRKKREKNTPLSLKSKKMGKKKDSFLNYLTDKEKEIIERMRVMGVEEQKRQGAEDKELYKYAMLWDWLHEGCGYELEPVMCRQMGFVTLKQYRELCRRMREAGVPEVRMLAMLKKLVYMVENAGRRYKSLGMAMTVLGTAVRFKQML